MIPTITYTCDLCNRLVTMPLFSITFEMVEYDKFDDMKEEKSGHMEMYCDCPYCNYQQLIYNKENVNIW